MMDDSKSASRNSDEKDSWESLAKDLFGVEFPSSQDEVDDLDDLLDDPFLEETGDNEVDDEAIDSEDSESESFESEPALAPGATAEEHGDNNPSDDESSGDDNIDIIFEDDWSFEEVSEVDEDSSQAVVHDEEPSTGRDVVSTVSVPDAGKGVENDAPDDDLDLELESEADTDNIDDDDELEEDDNRAKAKAERDRFWDALDDFGPDELGTPHIEQAVSGGRPGRDPGIRMISEAPAKPWSASQNEEDTENTEFGLGVLDDVDVGDSDDEDRSDDEETQTEETPKRRRRRPRRRRRRKDKVSSDIVEESIESSSDVESDDSTEDQLKSKSSHEGNKKDSDSSAKSEDRDSGDFDSEEADGEEGEDLDESPNSRYRNVPTWEEAISHVVKLASRNSSQNDPGEDSEGKPKKSRSRGGRRRRGKKQTSGGN